MGIGDRAPAGPDLAGMREVYSLAGLDESDIAPDWPTQLRAWLSDAVAAGLPEPNAMVLATASPDGLPACRTVLCKGLDADGVAFYTNLESDKSRDLHANPRAAATFPWIALQRQVHVRGPVQRMSDEAARAYWATRPRGSQIGAWASPQSRVIDGRPALEALQRDVEARFGSADEQGDPIPLPPFWGGWRIRPATVEFWQGRVARLHDRLRYRDTGSGWVIERLAP
jgi:pyridoxamine 5'-phosphate oxidase